MKTNALLLLALLGTVSFVLPAHAQTSSTGTSSTGTSGKMSSSKMASNKKSTTSTKKAKAKAMPKHPKNEVTKLVKDRKTNATVKQVTVDPKKSPGKHADNLSKNVNHELNRESKDINHALSGKKQ